MNQTPLHACHVDAGARMVDFAGWDMPVQYTSIIDEHNAVRTAAGLFDISHMGRLYFTGPDAAKFLDYIVTNDVTRIAPGQIRYALVTNESGGILDDVLVYSLDDAWMLVVNASNREKIVDWIEQHRQPFDVTVEDRTLTHAMVALQGPDSIGILSGLTDIDPASLKYYTGRSANVIGQPAYVSRTGYTGEDGVEIIIVSDHATELWSKLFDVGKPHGLLPAGLGCRDTLRLEAAMPLYGHELDETIDPLTAGLSFAVKLGAGDFIGKDALADSQEKSDRQVRVGLELDGRRIAREGAEILMGDQPVGTVTSGTFSPTLQKSIAMAYVVPRCASAGTVLDVDIRGKTNAASVVALPFYRRD